MPSPFSTKHRRCPTRSDKDIRGPCAYTYATRLLESGAAIKFISAQMGHSDIQITYDNYIDVTDEFKRVQIRPFEKYMDSVLGETSSEITDLSDYIS